MQGSAELYGVPRDADYNSGAILATDGPAAGLMNINSGANSSLAGRSSSEAPTYTFFSLNKKAFSG